MKHSCFQVLIMWDFKKKYFFFSKSQGEINSCLCQSPSQFNLNFALAGITDLGTE